MSNLTIHSSLPQTQLINRTQATAAAPEAAKSATPISAATTLDSVSLSAQAKTSRGLNLKQSALAAGMAAVPAAALALMHDNKAAGIGYGLGLSAGAGLAYLDLGNGTANSVKNVAAGAVIGGSLAGTISNQLIVKVLLGEKAKYAVAAGAVAGAGFAIYKEIKN
ncbi:MAG: hypothetical protein CVV27_20985 [Candidatus Melainabacteria bacterium HGW-Melainabacteria-1]|nr:MAG: hypothetical protein CVV27_20985 [Candidatus Melainabacteria bacterium HGW-Melainabacteria-1]